VLLMSVATPATDAEGEPQRFPAFPPGFLWGVATAAYQIEGAADDDGRGPSIWDTFCRVPGAVANGDTGDVACDHYHRLDEDLDLISDLGVGAYRFSVSWSRVQPAGRGRVEPRGIDFYRRLVDGLLARGIRPFLTLYHWDLPQGLEDDGGWRNRDTAYRFAEYAGIVHEALGGEVADWATLNEPYCSAIAGYAEGRHAPGVREGHGALAAAHHLLLGHGLAVRAMRASAGQRHRFGIVLNQSPSVPISDEPTDVAAARRQDLLLRRQFTDPLLGRRYPADSAEAFGEISDFSFRRDGDLAIIGTPLDFLGVNYYYRLHVGSAPYQEPEPSRRTANDIGVRSSPPAEVSLTGNGWPVEPLGLTSTLTDLSVRYPGLPPVYLTENGCVCPGGGELDDQFRIDFVREHLRAAHAALTAGVDLRGYFYWSLLDNFEWAHGYKHRFGLVHVDYPTGRRTPRASFAWYRDAISD
jgi:beta-glucosidase